MRMNRDLTTILIAAACVVIGAGGYWLYQERNRGGVEISVGGRSLTIETR